MSYIFYILSIFIAIGMIIELNMTTSLVKTSDWWMNSREIVHVYNNKSWLKTYKELKKLDVKACKKIGAQLNVPLGVGELASIEGLEPLKEIPCVKDFIQYYHVGDSVLPKHIGTLGQHFGRFTMVADTEEEIFAAVERVTKELLIVSTEGSRMNQMLFDIKRTEK